MSDKFIFIYSGQGTQFYQMGRELYYECPSFKRTFDLQESIVKKEYGFSVKNQVFNSDKKKSDFFDCLKYTHPGIFFFEYALSEVLMDYGIYPDYLAGYSLGELIAATVAGAISLNEAIDFTIRQSEVIEKNCASGKMIAVLTNSSIFYQEDILYSNSTLVSINTDNHFIISLEENSLEKIKQRLNKKNITYQVLPVNFAFHSPGINKAKSEILELLSRYSIGRFKYPLISGAYGKIITEVLPAYGWDVLRGPVKLKECYKVIMKLGNIQCIDLSPMGSFANFLKYAGIPNERIYTISTPLGQEMDNLMKVKNKFQNKEKVNTKRNDHNIGEKEIIAYVFPGQGSQKVGMGINVFKKYHEYVQKADKILGYSIENLCLSDTDNNLDNTQFTQPALYTVCILTYLQKIKETGIKPDFVAGHSLGEYCALFAAGYYDFETGLRLVQKRGILMSKQKGGGMAAVIGLEDEQVREILVKNNLSSLDIANFNCPGQVVISGLVNEIEKAPNYFISKGAKMYIPLKVSGAFHSRYMKEVRDEFLPFLKGVKFSPPNIPVISNVTARPYDLAETCKLLADQICMSVNWTESIRYLMGKGVTKFEEIGPGNVLSKLITKITTLSEPLVVTDISPSLKTHEKKESSPKKKTCKAKKRKTEKVIKMKPLKINSKKIKSLGSQEFKKTYNLDYPYYTGGMYRGISSARLVIKMGKAKMLSFLGTYRMGLNKVEKALDTIQEGLNDGEPYGCNISYSFFDPVETEVLLELCISRGVKVIEISGFLQLTPALVKYRLKGIHTNGKGVVIHPRRIIAKIRNPETADLFLSPPHESLVKKLIDEGQLTPEEGAVRAKIPMADDLCILPDSGWRTDGGSMISLFPIIQSKRDEFERKYKYKKHIHAGIAGGIGSPQAVGIAFLLGADFISTGSINQCTIESELSDDAKILLQNAGVRDTEYIPDFELFEMGVKSQVLKKGVFFPARANAIFNLYKQYNSLDEFNREVRIKLETKYFKNNFDEIFKQVKILFPSDKIKKAEKKSKYRMLLTFKWYLDYTARLPITLENKDRMNYQIQCGPALGALNSFLKGTDREPWYNRNVDELALILLHEGKKFIESRKY